MKALWVLLLQSILLPVWAVTPQFEKKVFTAKSGNELLYRVLYPENYDASAKKKYPLVLFLHGGGERGTDNEKQLMHGAEQFLNPVNREKYPAIVLFPQCPPEFYWALDSRPEKSLDNKVFPQNPPLSKIFVSVKELLDKFIADERVDTRRIYVVGLSMGGMGTFDMAARYPDLFAAAVPICGGVYPERLASAAKKVKFRIFHGDADGVVPVKNSREIYTYLKTAGADVEYIEFPGCNHGSWGPAFNRTDFMEWIFKQKK